MENDVDVLESEGTFTHIVYTADLTNYLAGIKQTVKAFCGKVWSPEIPIDKSKPLCRACSAMQKSWAA